MSCPEEGQERSVKLATSVKGLSATVNCNRITHSTYHVQWYISPLITIIQQRSLSRAARTDENSEQKGNRYITYWLGSLRNR